MISRTLYIDNKKVLPSLSSNYIDMVLTDPPYNLDTDEKRWYHREFLRICHGTIIVFMPPENPWVLPADQLLFWVKPISTKNTAKRYSRFVEELFVYELKDHKWNNGRHWSQYTNVFQDLVDDTSKHPFRKPPSLIERLIRNHTNPGDVILDPFAGSLVVADVAERLGRRYICIEKEERLA